MVNQKILVVTDNANILNIFAEILNEKKQLLNGRTVDYSCKPNSSLIKNPGVTTKLIPIDMKTQFEEVIENYQLVISAHCKQIFPPQLVERVKCINIHPGLNPHNRGWFPQVFSILNGLPLGATIHEIDEEIDHGNIIAQKEVLLHSWDTSLTAYNRVQDAEKELLEENIEAIFNGSYSTFPPKGEGNLNLKKDFDALRQIDLNQQIAFGAAIDKLRALTHPPYKNAYYNDPKTGKKVWVQINLEKDQE